MDISRLIVGPFGKQTRPWVIIREAIDRAGRTYGFKMDLELRDEINESVQYALERAYPRVTINGHPFVLVPATMTKHDEDEAA